MNWLRQPHPRLKITAIILAVLSLCLIVAVSLSDEPLRAYAERQANQSLDGYHVTIGALDFHPLGLSVDFRDLALTTDTGPDQPLVKIGQWSASIHWREILTGHVVSDHRIERPVLHLTRKQATDEARDERHLKEKGWQQALLQLYPLKVNELEIIDGDVTYVDSQNSKPLRVRDVHFHAGNIRNIQSGDRVYPSTVRLEARLFDSGHLNLDGTADFMREPHLGIDADVTLQQVGLTDLLPLAGRMSLQIREGTLSAKGHVEYSPTVQDVEFLNLDVDGLRVDYVHAGRSAATVKQATHAVAPKLEADQPKPQLTIRIRRGNITNSEVGFVNKDTDPGYRLFLTRMEMTIQDFSNRFDRGTGTVDLAGRFMGHGKLMSNARFRPQKPLPDFDLKVKIVKTPLKAMNNILRAHAGADVQAGTFAFFSEMTVQRGKVDGYVKPFFKDVDVYDPAQDEDQGFLKQVYEGLLDGLVTMFENEPREEVATETEVKGPLEDPRASTWDILLNLVKNAFLEAIVPGFKASLRR